MRLLKKYPNRRIYDTEESRFITLSDVREMVLRHEDFQVIDSKSGADLTRTTLLQIIADLESEGHASVLTNKILEDLIRFYGDAMGGVLGTLIERSIAAAPAQEGQRWKDNGYYLMLGLTLALLLFFRRGGAVALRT